MPQPNFTILYVDSPANSARLYGAVLGADPVEQSPTFVLFALATGAMLGLWSRHTVEPAATAPGGSEIAFSVESDDAVDETCRDWRRRGLMILQEPTVQDFGRSFVAVDPDGHRLRVFRPMP